MDRALERRHVVLRAHLVRQLEEAHEHGRHDLGVRDPVLRDQRQEFLGVEILHDHRGAAQPHDAHVEAQRSGMIERRRRQIDRVLVDAVELAADRQQRIVEVDRLRLDDRHHALGPSRRSRRIEHVVAGRLVGDRSRGKARDRVLPGVVARDRAVDHETVRGTLHQRRQLGGLVGKILRGDEQPGAAVGHDIVDLGGGEARADRGVDQARALRAPADLEEARIVLEEDRDMVAGLEAQRAEELRDAVGLLVELAIGHRLAAAGHDVGRLVGIGAGVMIGMHGGRIRADR